MHAGLFRERIQRRPQLRVPNCGNWAGSLANRQAKPRPGPRKRQLRIHGEMKWHWLLQTVPAPPPNSGMADALDEAKAAFAKRYEEVRRGK